MCSFAFFPVGPLKTLEAGPVFVLVSMFSFPIHSSFPLRQSSYCAVAQGLTVSSGCVLGRDMLLKYFRALFLENIPQGVDWGCFTMFCCEGSGKGRYVLLHLTQVGFVPEVDKSTSWLLSRRHDVSIDQDNIVIA